jgi:threonine synthase
VDLSGVNSINLARIIAQSAYYLAAAGALGSQARPASFIVPTGNFGNAFAGYAAAKMGAPIGRITAAVNANDILAGALGSGLYRRGAAAATMSPAMDIQVASNFERLYFEMSGRDAAATADAFAAFQAHGALSLPAELVSATQGVFTARSVSEAETGEALRRALVRYGELIDPHTAVALHVAERDPGPGPRVVLATAHPAKFPDAVEAATGRRPDVPQACLSLYDRPETFEPIDKDLGALTRRIREFAAA